MIIRYAFRFHMVKIFSLPNSSIYFLTVNKIKNERFHKPISFINYKYVHTEDRSKITDELKNLNTSHKKIRKLGVESQITLILPENEILLTTFEEAEQLAKQKNLNLVKVIDFDAKMKKPLYKLMTKSQFLNEDAKFKAQTKMKNKLSVKDKKIFNMTTKINQHDLDIKIRLMIKHIQKNRDVQINISKDGNHSKAEEIAKYITEELSEIAHQSNCIKKNISLILNFVSKVQEESMIKNVNDEEKNI